MMRCTVFSTPGSPAPIGFSEAAGMPGNFRFDFKTTANVPFTGIVDLFPQMVLRSFTQPGGFGYDIDIDDPTAASGIAKVPASAMNDEFHVEVYTRDATGAPQSMIAYGRHTRNGYGYQRASPLAPATYQTGPSGPAGPVGATGAVGPTGAPGVRGSRWYTGAGAPGTLPDVRVDGDMYLDETNGDVWRWTADTSSWALFKGI